MPRERPILMNAESVRGILEGRKQQTRRVIKPQPPEGVWFDRLTMPPHDWIAISYETGSIHEETKPYRCPYGTRGSCLWVRETWAATPKWTGKRPSEIVEGETIWYRAGGWNLGCEWPTLVHGPWRPSIHMCRWMSRITLEITGVRLARIRHISAHDAVLEGIIPAGYMGDPCDVADTAIDEFRTLWNSINGDRRLGWTANPWVWVIEFGVSDG